MAKPPRSRPGRHEVRPASSQHRAIRLQNSKVWHVASLQQRRPSATCSSLRLGYCQAVSPMQTPGCMMLLLHVCSRQLDHASARHGPRACGSCARHWYTMHSPAAHPLRVGRRVCVGDQGVLAGQRALEQQEPGAPGLTSVGTSFCGTRPGWCASFQMH